jgi:DeoR/GlpR family transcriptional regulator of sugar metabolism
MKYNQLQRKKHLTSLVSENRPLVVKELARLFNVSEMTVHRDLNQLQEQGRIERTHGGAVPSERMSFEFDFTSRRRTDKKYKKVIARRALDFIRPGDKLILDTGTTTLELAYLLRDYEGLTVITPSLAVASVLQFSKGVMTVLLGGIIRQGSPDLTGAVTESVLDMFMVDIAFQGADGIGLNGELFNSDIRIARVDKKMRKRAEKTIILSDSSKIGKVDFASNGSLSEVDALITDSRITDEQLSALNKSGTKIIIENI